MMLSLWNWDYSTRKTISKNRLELLDSFLSKDLQFVTKSCLEDFCETLTHSTGLSSLDQALIFLTFQELYDYYSNPVRRLDLMTEVLKYMAQFREKAFGEQSLIEFKSQLEQRPLDFLTLPNLQLITEDRIEEAFVSGTAHDWTIYFVSKSLIANYKKYGLTAFKSLVEFILIHEWVHLIQIELRLHLELVAQEFQDKIWEERWYEREAIYVSERVYQSRLHLKQCSHQIASKLIKEVYPSALSSSVVLFKEDMLIPYYEQLRTNMKNGFLLKLSI